MNTDQQEKLCFRLYLACFAHPDEAPFPQTYGWARNPGSVAMTDRNCVTVKIGMRTIGGVAHDWARVDIEIGARAVQLRGPIDVVETALKAIPDDLKVQK